MGFFRALEGIPLHSGGGGGLLTPGGGWGWVADIGEGGADTRHEGRR